MNDYKHTPPKSFYDVTWLHVKDWWSQEQGLSWPEDLPSEKYIILKQYNKTLFPQGIDTPQKPNKPIRYLNRVETSC